MSILLGSFEEDLSILEGDDEDPLKEKAPDCIKRNYLPPPEEPDEDKGN